MGFAAANLGILVTLIARFLLEIGSPAMAEINFAYLDNAIEVMHGLLLQIDKTHDTASAASSRDRNRLGAYLASHPSP